MTSNLLILAQRLSREELARAFRDGFDRDASAPILLFIFALALLGVMVWLGWRNQTVHQPADPTPLRIFNGLARELRLSLMDRRLLIRIANAQSLPNPLTLLVSPRTMRHHAAAYSQSLSARKRTRLHRRIASLRRTVFSN